MSVELDLEALDTTIRKIGDAGDRMQGAVKDVDRASLKGDLDVAGRLTALRDSYRAFQDIVKDQMTGWAAIIGRVHDILVTVRAAYTHTDDTAREDLLEKQRSLSEISARLDGTEPPQ